MTTDMRESTTGPSDLSGTPSGPEHAAASRIGRGFRWLAQSVPTCLILLGLGGLAYWVYHPGWTLPKFSSLTGNGAAERDDWCDAHGVPESQCVECQPGLLPSAKPHGWCARHGVHECPWEHPDVAESKRPPRITPADLDRARRALDLAERPENNPRYKLYLRRIQFSSYEAIEKAGVDIKPAEESVLPMVEAIAANGEVTYDPRRVASLSSPVPGRVWRVEQELGQPVRPGEVLALVEAAEVGKAKAEFLQALAHVDLRGKTLERLRPLAGTAVAGKEIPEAEAALREAQIRLVSAQQALVNLGLPVRGEDFQALAPEEIGRRVQFLGLPEAVTRTLDPRTTTANLIPVKVPGDLDGVVVARKAVAGEVVDASKALFVVADPRRLWLTLNVRQADLARFREKDLDRLLRGKPVRFRPDGSGHQATGTISWVSTAADEKTRTLQVRADLANPDGRLRANTFGAGDIVLREEKMIVVPTEAVHWDGNAYLVFVYDRNSPAEGAPKVFHVRTVRPGAQDGRNTEIIAGVLPGEMVATTGSGILRSELLKTNLGEG
jgi:cobalt-zinc-cadmium efflux system membrane fusion protein